MPSLSNTGLYGRTLSLFGLTIRDTTLPQAAASIINAAKSGQRLNVAFVNAHCVNQWHQDESYRKSLEAFDVVFADGVGMKIAAKAAGDDLTDNVNGTDLFPILCEEAAETGLPIFFLGAQRGRADKTARRMSLLHPGLNIAGTHHGFFETEADETAVIERINASGAVIVFVALGVPLQEKWIEQNHARLKANVILGVGGLFDYYSGAIERAPEPLRKNGLEWAWRLVLEPQRLWRRYVVGNVEFLARIAWFKFGNADLRSLPAGLVPAVAGGPKGFERSALGPNEHSAASRVTTPAAQTISAKQLKAPAHISRKVVSDLSAALSVAAAAVASWLLMDSAQTASVSSLFPAYVVLLAALLQNGSAELFSVFRQRDLDRQLGIHGLAIAGSITLGHLMQGHTSITLLDASRWFAASLGGGLGVLHLAQLLAKTRYFSRRLTRRVAVFGSGPISAKVYEEIRSQNTQVTFAGLFDDRVARDRLVDCGVPVEGNFDILLDKARRGEVDEVILALPQSATRRIADCARQLAGFPVDVQICTHVATEYPGRQLKHFQTSMLGSIGLLQLRERPLSHWGALAKRAEDVIFSLAVLIVTLPISIAAAIAIKLTSRGPVFFIQSRMGLNNRKIRVVKFRTMRVMEDGAAVTQASANDSRVTPVGRFLRKFSIDELPQLFNVLMGDMSLVGPRPHAIAHDKYFGSMVYRYANRHQIKPGITGLAQVSGFRGETAQTRLMSKRVQYDLWYIENWSLLLDLKIILLTPFSCLFDKKAY